MTDPKVSIIILSYKYPHIITVCLNSLAQTTGVPYEVVVVSNGNTPDVVEMLKQFKANGKIDTLVESPINTFFSEGNNIGFRASNPASEYVLCLNSDVAILRPDWLQKLVAWAEGVPNHKPNPWGFHPTKPSPGPRDIVSMGWVYDATVEPSHKRPDGFCLLIRRSVWRDFDPNFPFHNGMEHSVADAIRAGAKCGVLSQYGNYFVHREGACETFTKRSHEIINIGTADIPGWFNGLDIEGLDFTLGEHEHDSYILW